MGLVVSVTNIISTFVFRFIGFMIKSLYSLIVMLADANILENEAFDNVKNNIFGLIGLFMVFKLAFSIIQYITNPDKLSDSSVGASKVLTKVVVVLVLLGTVDTIFTKAFELQGLILKNGVLERIIFGASSSDVSGKIDQFDQDMVGSKVKTSDYLAYSILAPFVTYNTEKDIWGGLKESDLALCDEFIKATNIAYKNPGDICESKCYFAIKDEDDDAAEAMCQGLADRNMYKALIDVAMLRINKEPVLVVDGLFGLLVGAVCVVVLVIIAVGVAIRSVKLAFLSLIAPLPIISYIDPKDNTNGMFHKWKNESIKTFLELFIRLLAFYFAVMVITRVLVDTDGFGSFTGSGNYKFEEHPMVVIFLIIGAFLFALQLPKLIENLFGSLGGFSRDARSTGAIAAGLGGIAGGIIGGGISNAIGTAKTLKDENDGKLTFGAGVRSAFAGVTGAVGTGRNAIGGALKGMKASGEGLSGSKWNDIASGAIARTGAIRNARLTLYPTGRTKKNGEPAFRSAYPAFPSIRRSYGKFAEMAGIKDNYSQTGKLKGAKKSREDELRIAQNNLAKLSNERMSAMQQAAVSQRQSENLEAAIDKDKFSEFGGRFDSSLGDYVFGTGSSAKTYTDLVKNGGLYEAMKSGYKGSSFNDFVNSYNKIATEQDNILRETSVLRSAMADRARSDAKLESVTKEYDKYQTAVNDAQKRMAGLDKQISAVEKANKKS